MPPHARTRPATRFACLALFAFAPTLLAAAPPPPANPAGSFRDRDAPPKAAPDATDPAATPNTPTLAEPPVQPVRFDPDLDVSKALAEAGRLAPKDNRQVLVIWGRNDSTAPNTMLARALAMRNPSRVLSAEYIVVHADVGAEGQGPANLKAAEKMEIELSQDPPGQTRSRRRNRPAPPPPPPGEFHPVLSVHEPDGTVVDVKPLSTLFVRRGGVSQYESALIVDFLIECQSERPDAAKLLESAIADAAKQRKSVLLCFSQTHTPDCRAMRAWLDEPDIRGLFDNAFVTLNLDIERTAGGVELFERFAGPNPDGVPWFVVLDAKGEPVVASQEEGKPNIGLPTTDEQIERFKAFLLRAGTGMTDLGLRIVSDSLVKRRDASASAARPAPAPAPAPAPTSDAPEQASPGSPKGTTDDDRK